MKQNKDSGIELVGIIFVLSGIIAIIEGNWYIFFSPLILVVPFVLGGLMFLIALGIGQFILVFLRFFCFILRIELEGNHEPE